MKVVLDANVLVSAFTRPSTPALLIDRWTEQRFELTLSTHILDGIRRAWNKPYFRPLITYDEAQSHLDMLTREAEIVTPVDTVRGVAEDLEDDLVLATAVRGRADFLVTGVFAACARSANTPVSAS